MRTHKNLKSIFCLLSSVFYLLSCASIPTPPSKTAERRPPSAIFKIGVLLPLSGPFARFGESALDGIACAIGLFDPCGKEAGKVQIVVWDTKGNPEAAAQGVQELAAKEKVAAIIGPLLSGEALAAATASQALGVPMIVLAPQEGITQAGDFIFQHSLLPEMETQALVENVSKAGLKKFIILYPKNRYGERYRELFHLTLGQKGEGKIVAQAGYTPDIPDFVGILEQLLRQPAVGKLLKSDSKDKVGIFIPDSHKQILQMVAALESLSIQGPKLIGTSRWHHPQLLAASSSVLEGAILDSPFYPEAALDVTHEFADSFAKAYGNTPAWLEAFAFDSARLILDAFASKGNDDPLDIRNALLNTQTFSSVVGPVSWNERRISQWPLAVLTVREGKFTPLQ